MSNERQITWVIDLNKCIGCQTCSVACKVLWTREEGEEHQWWRSVNTMPGEGTPRGWEEMGGGFDPESGELRPGHQPTREEFGGAWEYNFNEVYFGGTRGQAFLEPQAPRENRWAMNWDEDQGGGKWPNSYFFYLPRMCNHCTRPACLEACPQGAIYKRDDGIVLRDEERCAGSGNCMAACPYKKIYFNEKRNVAQHCIGCFPRIEAGVAPACVRQCPGRAMFVGWRDDQDGAVHKLVDEWQLALPLHAEFGTVPNVYYVPPLSADRLQEDMTFDEGTSRIPPDYLQSLFGPRATRVLEILEEERAKVRAGGTSEIIDTLIAYKWEVCLGPFTADPVAARASE